MATANYEHVYGENLIVTPIDGYGIKALAVIEQGDLVSVETDNNNSLLVALDAANETFAGMAFEDATGGAADDVVFTRVIKGPILCATGTAAAIAAPAETPLFIDAKNTVGIASDVAQSVYVGRKVGTRGSIVYFLSAALFGDTGS